MNSRPRKRAGFTLVELLVAVGLAGIVMTGMLTTYVFLGRNLIRLNNQQMLDDEHRRVLLEFSQDFRKAIAVTSASDTAVTFTVPTATGAISIIYTYTAGANFTGRLVRTTNPETTTRTMINTLGSFDFDYFDASDAAVTNFSQKLTSVRKVAFDYTAQAGYARTGTRTPIETIASGRLTLRNPAFLQ